MWKVTVFSYAVQWSFTAQIDKENLNFIPSDFIGIQMQVKAVAIRRSVQYQGNILPVELAVYDNEGMKGLCIETSLEREAAKEAMANIGGGLGTSISFARSAGQQVAMDITRGLMQGGSQYLAKKFRTVKVHLKAGYELMLYAKE